MHPVDHPEVDRDEARSVEPVESTDPPTGAEPDGVAVSDEPAPSVAAGEPSAGEAPRGGRAARRTLWALIAALAVLALSTSLLAADAIADRNRERRDRQAVEEVAGRLATALSTYDYRDFEATKRRVLSLSTGAFALEYERAVAALASLIDQTKATSEATAGDVFVGNLGDGKASAIVVIEIRASGVGGPRVSVDNYVDLSLVKVEGEWKVDGVRNLNLGVSGGGTAAPTGTTPAGPAGTAKPPP